MVFNLTKHKKRVRFKLEHDASNEDAPKAKKKANKITMVVGKSYYPSSPRMHGPLYFDSVLFWGCVSVIFCAHFMGLILGYAFGGNVCWTINLCGQPLCFFVLSVFMSNMNNSRIQFSNMALVLYAFRLFINLLAFHDLQNQEDTEHQVGYWAEDLVSLRMLVFYEAISMFWTFCALFPHLVGSMSSVSGSPAFSIAGIAMVMAGLGLQWLAPMGTVELLFEYFLAGKQVSNVTLLAGQLELDVVCGEVVFWLGVSIVNAPVIFAPQHTRYTRYYNQPSSVIVSNKTKTNKKKHGTTILFLFFCFFSVAMVMDSSIPALRDSEWTMLRTLILSRHGFLKANRPSSLGQRNNPEPPTISSATLRSMNPQQHLIHWRLGKRHRAEEI